MAKSKTVQKSVVQPSSPKANPPVIKVRDLSWPLRTLTILAATAGAILIIYVILLIAVYLQL